MRFAVIFPLLFYVISPVLLQSAQTAENISAANEKAFEVKIKELMKVEFFEVVRGRAKPKLLRVNDAAHIQEIVKSKDVFFKAFYGEFQKNMVFLDETFSKVPPFVPAEDAKLLKEIIIRHAVSLVLLEEKIKNTKSFFELRRVLEYSHDRMVILPLQIKMLSKTFSDMHHLAGGGFSNDMAHEQTILKPIFKKIFDFVEVSFSDASFSDMDTLTRWFSFLARIELEWMDAVSDFMEIKTNGVVDLMPPDVVTATFRTQDGLVIVYGNKENIAHVMEKMKNENNEGLSTMEMEALILDKKLPGILRLETFYSESKSNPVFFQDTVRSAEMGEDFPFVEGLEVSQSARLLEVFGYHVETVQDCGGKELSDAKEILMQRLIKKHHAVILCGTDAQSTVFTGRK